MNGPPEFRPVADVEAEEIERIMEKVRRDVKAAEGRPLPPVYSPGKFTEPLGLDADGNYQLVTPQELAHDEAVRRRAAGGVDPAVALDRRTAAGCLFGLAYGDALGAPTEFLSVAQIEARWGRGGPRELTGNPALITDDTQMTLAVARALHVAGVGAEPATVTQLLRDEFVAWSVSPDNNRAPGNTCLTACAGLARGLIWTDATVVGSKGCGANMRVAPVGLVREYDLTTVAGVAQLQAALTHGHPTALAASDLTAYAIRLLREGVDVSDLPRLLGNRCQTEQTVYHQQWLGSLWEKAGAGAPADFIAHGWRECATAIAQLVTALRTYDGREDPCRFTGAGWIAEEALTTALLCAVTFRDDPVGALARAATTSGDSDSIACLTGAFLGASAGMDIWPQDWSRRIEHGPELAQLATYWDPAKR